MNKVSTCTDVYFMVVVSPADLLSWAVRSTACAGKGSLANFIDAVEILLNLTVIPNCCATAQNCAMTHHCVYCGRASNFP